MINDTFFSEIKNCYNKINVIDLFFELDFQTINFHKKNKDAFIKHHLLTTKFCPKNVSFFLHNHDNYIRIVYNNGELVFYLFGDRKNDVPNLNKLLLFIFIFKLSINS